ncbi:MAG: Glu-tRNA(Gln) amidotransferase subunit GatD [Thermoplasmata archaeon]|nr:Glu-tRNA(Gln) amidotransferase subunit GatD [Thermoplasmata archaeon]
MSGPSAPDPWETLRRLPLGRRIELSGADGRVWRGTLVPSHELSGPRIAQIKLENGYNVGVRVEPTDSLRLIDDEAPKENGGRPPTAELAPGPAPEAAPWVALLSTGGTIASRVDYRTGGVRPVHDKAGILSFYPDLEAAGPVRIVPVFDRLSEDISPDDWIVLADHVARAFTDGARGVVIAHGTDTLAFTAAALSFLLEDLPGPVVLVGAQRSPDRPSSDGFTNLTTAVRIAREAEIGEVVVLMHAGLSDDRFAVHRGTRVRKMHSSRRDAFDSRNVAPIGMVDATSITWAGVVRAPAHGPPRLDRRLGREGGLLWFYPGLAPTQADEFVSRLRGVVLAGTGLGHVSSVHLPWIRSAIARGVVVVMTTQCLGGAVDPYVYATGRELLRAGVVYAEDLLPETAYVKLLWALGRSRDPREVARLLLTDRSGELSERRVTLEGA